MPPARALPAVNGVAFHPFLPLLATASGQRRYPLAPKDEGPGSGGDSSSSSSDVSSSDGSSLPSAREESDGDSGMAGSDGAAAAQPRAFPGLTADENVLRVWRFAARLLPSLAEGTEDGAAVAADGADPSSGPEVVPAEAAAGSEAMLAD